MATDFQEQLRQLAEKRRRQAEARAAAGAPAGGLVGEFHALEREAGAHPSQANSTINARDTAAADLGWNDQTVTGMEALNGAKPWTPTRHEVGLVPGRVSSQLPEYAQKELLARIKQAQQAAAPKPERMPTAELAYLRGNPQISQDRYDAVWDATRKARAARNPEAVVASVNERQQATQAAAPPTARQLVPNVTRAPAPYSPAMDTRTRFVEAATTPLPAPARPTMTMMGETPAPSPAPAAPPAPRGPTTDAQVERLVSAGMDPAEARRIVERQTQVAGPLPAGLWARDNTPESIRALKERIAKGKQDDARMDGFAADYNAATGGPQPKPTLGVKEGDGFGGGVLRPQTNVPWADVVGNREAAAAARWEQRGVEAQQRRDFDAQVAAKEKARRDAMDPAAREQMDAERARKMELNRLYHQYQKDIGAHERDGVSFESYAKNNGFGGEFTAGEADYFVGRANTAGEKAALRQQRQNAVAQNAMERAGNGHLLPQRTLDNPESTPNMRRAAYMTLARINPGMADEYIRLAELESGEVNAAAQAKAAADLARFNKQPPPKPEQPVVNIPQVAIDVANAAPAGSDRHAVITATAARMPGETPEEREVAATSAVDSVMWNRHASGDVAPGDWAYGPMMEMVYPLKDGVPSDKPISEEQFVRLAMMKGRVAAEQARAIYQYMTTGARPGEVPNNHAPVGAPDTDVAAVE